MLTRTLAAWIAGLRPGHVPEAVKREVALLSLDTFGCALSGIDQPWTQAIRGWALEGGRVEHGGARLWGDAQARLRPAEA